MAAARRGGARTQRDGGPPLRCRRRLPPLPLLLADERGDPLPPLRARRAAARAAIGAGCRAQKLLGDAAPPRRARARCRSAGCCAGQQLQLEGGCGGALGI